MWSLTLWMDDFLCIDAHDLEHLGLIFQTCPNSPKILIQVSLSSQLVFTLEQGLIWCKMWSLKLWMNFYVSMPLLGVFPWLALIPKYTKTGIISRPSHGLTLVSFSIKSWVTHLQWRSMYDFLTLIWSIWVQTNQIFSMPQILCI